ncbi:transcriptional regulator, LacI family [Arboricoccus pini]|uniref:Transcriptional regulator, LacI family n=1 Tax=Arboricoccus pini TaxID=1963835 RepID=A0A212QQ79_9PROT|nr:LacI family transcriptional regulator [Arboricoccus pini]SNB61625.1 transcriptional regulator, LacI family [Arboricoccus pini]
MAKQKATLRTIAEASGFAVTTVSRALKDAPELSQATKARIRTIALAQGYAPDRAALRLRTGQTYILAFILSQEDEINRIARNMIIGLSQGLRGTPYQLIVVPQFPDEDPLQAVRYVVETGAADGLIISHTMPQDERVRYLLERDIPFVTHGRTELQTPHAYYDYDNFRFALEATRLLLRRGRQRIILVPPITRFTYAGLQIDGYRRAMIEAGLEPNVATALSIESSPMELKRFASSMAREAAPPDAYVCGSEEACIALIGGIEASGMRLGCQVDLVGKQTSDLVDVLSAVFDTASEDFSHTGRILAELLLRRLAGESAGDLQRLETPIWTLRTPASER